MPADPAAGFHVRPTRLDAHWAACWRRSGAWTDSLLTDWDAAAASAEHVIVVEGERRVTTGQVRELARRVAARLRADGVSSGDAVVLQVPNWWEAVVVGFAVFELGAVLVPVLPSLRERELGQIFTEIRPVAAIVPESFRGAALRDRLVSSDHAPDLVYALRPVDATQGRSLSSELSDVGPPTARPTGTAAPSVDARASRSADDPCVVLYTSGTSGGPKGVIHTHNTLRAEVFGLAGAHEMTDADVILLPMPVTHIGGLVYGMLMPALTGTRCVFLDVWDPGRCIDLLAEEGVTVVIGMPVFLRGILDHPRFSTGAARSLRLFSMGGTRVTSADVLEATARLGCWCKRSYGLTEAPTLTTGPHWDTTRRATTDGIPVAPSQVRIVDKELRDVAAGVEGEIVCVAPELFVGYVDARQNDPAFTPDGWFRTGDTGLVDEDGFLSVTGRLKDVIIRGGENISAKELEDLVITLPGLTDVAIVAMPDPLLGERLCAFLESDQPFVLRDIVSFLRNKGVASYKLPERVEVRAQLPRNSAGKLRKDVMRAEIRSILESESESETSPAS